MTPSLWKLIHFHYFNISATLSFPKGSYPSFPWISFFPLNRYTLLTVNVLPSRNIPEEPWLIPVNSALANSRVLKGQMLFPSAQIYYSTRTWKTMLSSATLIGFTCWSDCNRSGASLLSKLPARGNPLA